MSLCCAGWETFLSPFHQQEHEANHSTGSGTIQWGRVQELAVSPGSVLPCQKRPPRAFRCAQDIWAAAEMSDRWSQPLTHLSYSFPWKTVKINLYWMTNSS